jgi:hypoxanthine phosphoribosyltransferase
MGGAVVFTGHLLCRLSFPLEFDVLKASRYGQATGGGTVEWSLRPKARLKGRSILLLDDILDEGHTLKEIRDWLEQEGAADVKIAVLFDKHHGREKPLSADYVGLALPDRYVFGWGMDVAGYWRNLDEVWALQDSGFELLKG